MRPIRSATGWLLALASLLAAAGAGLVGVGLSADPADASAAGALVAHSVCEAHELEARKAADPSLEIQIPEEFSSPWPTREACLSYQAASDPNTPGLLQPIPFSHKHHAGLYQIDCLYCHSGTDRARAAGVPSVQMCMGCHGQFPPTYDEFEGIRALKGYWERKESIPWNQIYRLPEYVKFRHNRHIQAGVACQTCHGPVQEMDKVVMNDSTHWWPWLLPTKEPEMGWCINCHRQNKATQDCLACHY